MDNKNIFFIFDAKYYNIQFQKDLKLEGQPGIYSITKQYLYELAYKEFIKLHDFDEVQNCFLFPIDSLDNENRGFVKLEMLNNQDLVNIQTLFISASEVYQLYLEDKILDLSSLEIFHFEFQ